MPALFSEAVLEQTIIDKFTGARYEHVSGGSLHQALEDTEKRENLYGPFDTAEEAVASMLED